MDSFKSASWAYENQLPKDSDTWEDHYRFKIVDSIYPGRSLIISAKTRKFYSVSISRASDKASIPGFLDARAL